MTRGEPGEASKPLRLFGRVIITQPPIPETEMITCVSRDPCGFAAVGAHRQVIALRDVVMADGESFAITRAIMAELYPDGQLLFYEGGGPGAFRQEVKERLGLDPADDDGGS
jgi:hypothetical protein